MFIPGDPISHPRHGFGTIHGLTRLDPAHPVPDIVAGDALSGQEQDYYDIRLMDHGTLFVPVNRAPKV